MHSDHADDVPCLARTKEACSRNESSSRYCRLRRFAVISLVGMMSLESLPASERLRSVRDIDIKKAADLDAMPADALRNVVITKAEGRLSNKDIAVTRVVYSARLNTPVEFDRSEKVFFLSRRFRTRSAAMNVVSSITEPNAVSFFGLPGTPYSYVEESDDNTFRVVLKPDFKETIPGDGERESIARAMSYSDDLVTVELVAQAKISATGFAQIGETRAEIERMPGAERVHSGPKGAFDAAVRVPADRSQGETITPTYFIRGGNVAAVRLSFDNDTGIDAAFAHAAKVAGIAAPAAGAGKRAPQWMLDPHQVGAYQPLGASGLKRLRQNLPAVRVGTIHLAPNGSDARPIFQRYAVCLGELQYSAMKCFVPFVRSDGAAYMSADMTISDDKSGALTRSVTIAEPEAYWLARMARLQELSRQPLRGGSLVDLRPKHLGVQAAYDRIALDHLPVEMAADLLSTWKANALVGAVDNPRASPFVLDELRRDCPTEQSLAALKSNLEKKDLEVQIRRARIIKAFGSGDWFMVLAANLKRKEKSRVDRALEVLREIALSEAQSAEEIDELGADYNRWHKWHLANMKRHAKKP